MRALENRAVAPIIWTLPSSICSDPKKEVEIDLQPTKQDGRFIEEVFTRTDTTGFVALLRRTP